MDLLHIAGDSIATAEVWLWNRLPEVQSSYIVLTDSLYNCSLLCQNVNEILLCKRFYRLNRKLNHIIIFMSQLCLHLQGQCKQESTQVQWISVALKKYGSCGFRTELGKRVVIQWIPVALEKYGIRIPSRKYHSTGYVRGAISHVVFS